MRGSTDWLGVFTRGKMSLLPSDHPDTFFRYSDFKERE